MRLPAAGVLDAGGAQGTLSPEGGVSCAGALVAAGGFGRVANSMVCFGAPPEYVVVPPGRYCPGGEATFPVAVAAIGAGVISERVGGVLDATLAVWLAAALPGEVAYLSDTARSYRSTTIWVLVGAASASVEASAELEESGDESTGVAGCRLFVAIAYRSALGEGSEVDTGDVPEVAALGL